MKTSGRRRWAFKLTLACAVAGVNIPFVTADESDGQVVVITKALIVDDEIPTLLPIRQEKKQEDVPAPPPIGSTAKQPSALPQSQTATPGKAKTEPVITDQKMTPIPVDGGIVGPIEGPIGMPYPGYIDQYPVYYRDRPKGRAAEKAAIIANNRGSEPDWYKRWRCEHYGYYPTQWRPWPMGWHEARNMPPPPFAHPYDLKQPEPDFPDGKRPELPSRLKNQNRDRDAGLDGAPRKAPPLDDPPPGKKKGM